MRALSLSYRTLFLVIGVVGLMLSGCGSDGSNGAPGEQGPQGEQGPPGPSIGPVTGLSITVTGATVNSNPVVTFKVTNQLNQPFSGLGPSDFRFTIAKLITPTSIGASPYLPSNWQDYVLRTKTGLAGSPGEGKTMVQANRETPNANAAAGAPGSLVNHGDGSYTYTFRTDIKNVACPAPCTDAFGRTLDLSYNGSLPHRIAVQTNGRPYTTGTYDFIPNTGTQIAQREVVNYDNCNECHNRLIFHGSRVDTMYCVTCHNLGNTDPSSYDKTKDGNFDGQPAAVASSGALDFRILIHKLHRGPTLPSVGGCNRVYNGDTIRDSCKVPDPTTSPPVELIGEYGIYGYSNTLESFADVEFPQDIRNCTKCHKDAPQADNYKNMPSVEACGSCHDNIKFDVAGPPTGADPNGHPGGVVYNYTTHLPTQDCLNCHVKDQIGGDIAAVHQPKRNVARGKFQFNILEICGMAVDQKTGLADTAGVDACAPSDGATKGYVTVKFSVTDPTGATTHGYGNKYDIFADPEFWDSTGGTNRANVTVDIAWDTRDYNNTGGSQDRPARANQFSVYGSTSASTRYGQDNPIPIYGAADASAADGTYILTAATPLPAALAGSTTPLTGAVALEGRAYNTVGDYGLTGSSINRTPIKGAVAYFGIGSNAMPEARRVVADAKTKCDNCHDQLSLHGNNRNDNVQLCVLCHNPNNTDASDRDHEANGLPIKGTSLDEKKEESIDFKRMIHGIHAGAQTHLADGSPAHGFREKGMVVSGHDYSEMRFPGILSDCHTCHLEDPDTMTLEDRSASGGANWVYPTRNGILGSSVDTTPDPTFDATTAASIINASLQDPTDDSKISPTAAVCSSCHDSEIVQAHMEGNGGLFGKPVGTAVVTQSDIDNSSIETCAVCHGPGAVADVEVVHEEATATEQGLSP